MQLACRTQRKVRRNWCRSECPTFSWTSRRFGTWHTVASWWWCHSVTSWYQEKWTHTKTHWKGKSLLDDKLKSLNVSFVKMYRRWKYHINGLKRSIKCNDAEDLMDEIVNSINSTWDSLDSIYLEISAISSPEPDVRRMNDTCRSSQL